MRGRNGGIAERVAVVRCWFAIRRHALRTAMRGSGSAICSSESCDNSAKEEVHSKCCAPLCQFRIQLGVL
jgi:hypothetical protein